MKETLSKQMKDVPIIQASSSNKGITESEPSSSRGSGSSWRRVRVPDRPKNASVSLWGFLKNCVGKDLSTVALPVNSNEPLSMLQRLTEDLEYSHLLDKAANCSCPYEQLAYIAVFIVSGYACTLRTTKPFNPLLGETFECDRTEDLGWRMISEQVSHHPPISAQYCEGRDWILWQEFSIESKLSGNDVQITPKGSSTVEFKKGNGFSWNKVVTTVHNFLVGSIWVEQQGDVDIIGKNNAEGITSKLKFIPYTGSSLKRIKGEMRKVKGDILDAKGNSKWILDGTWDDQIEITPVLSVKGSRENSDDIIFGQPLLAWKCKDLSEGSQNYYSIFACQLNEPEAGIAPTDSRLRPDQRLMEEGKWDEANTEKLRLEEKQRARAKEVLTKRERDESQGLVVEPYQPTWFKAIQKEDGQVVHVYRENYWQCKEKQDWSMCPNIFS